jgi:ATP-dependent protease ClpP protease subunit
MFTPYDTIYTIDCNSDEPIMLLNKHIGYDEDYGQGIMGDLFQKELLYLDTLGKKRIQIHINSVGGSVMDGMNIYSAILKSTTPVDCYNVGIAASTAGWLFAAGRKRYMADYAKVMMHNPYNSNSEVDKALKEFQDSICTMLSERSQMDKANVLDLMNKETWLNADECMAVGLCDVVEASSDLNKKRMNAALNMMEMYAISNSIINHTPKIKKQNMTNVAKALGLDETANEADIVSAIASLKEAKNQVVEVVKTDAAELNAIKETLNSLKLEAQNTKNAIAKDNAIRLVNEYKNRLGEAKPEVVNAWVEKATADYAGTENLLKELPLNIKSVSVEPVLNTLQEGETPTTAAHLMARLNVQNRKK